MVMASVFLEHDLILLPLVSRCNNVRHATQRTLFIPIFFMGQVTEQFSQSIFTKGLYYYFHHFVNFWNSSLRNLSLFGILHLRIHHRLHAFRTRYFTRTIPNTTGG